MISLLIPAYKPDDTLTGLINDLVSEGINSIIVVDDGSGNEYEKVFNKIRANKFCKVCSHPVNQGKGKAIKTGLQFAIDNIKGLQGIITADADGQHLPVDICNVRNCLIENPNELILGCREFDEKIPMRSKIGNVLTKKVFHILTGQRISDTQTGLRGIPAGYIPDCIRMDGDRYEYEINMLLSARKKGIKLREVPINTVYLDNNKSSHFNPVLDSLKIYFILFRFLLSSLSTSLIDFMVFFLSSQAGFSILTSMVMARLVAGNYNFAINKRVVFKNKSKIFFAFTRYWLLVFFLGLLSYVGIWALTNYLSFDKYLAKVLVESILFIVSFIVQRTFVFPAEKSLNNPSF